MWNYFARCVNEKVCDENKIELPYRKVTVYINGLDTFVFEKAENVEAWKVNDDAEEYEFYLELNDYKNNGELFEVCIASRPVSHVWKHMNNYIKFEDGSYIKVEMLWANINIERRKLNEMV